MDTVGTFSAATCCGNDHEGGWLTVAVGIDLCGEVHQALCGSVYHALVTSEFYLERGPAVWRLHDRVDFFAAVHLAPSRDRTFQWLRVYTQVAEHERLEVKTGGLRVGEKVLGANAERSGSERRIDKVADGCFAEPCSGAHVRLPGLRILGELQSVQGVKVCVDRLLGWLGRVAAGDVCCEFGELDWLSDPTTQRCERSPEPIGGSPGGTKAGNVNFNDLGELVCQPAPGESLIVAHERRPPADYDPRH